MDEPTRRFYVDVKDKKSVVMNWNFELGSPNVLKRQGWLRDSLKVGADNSAATLWPYFFGASLHWYHLRESTVSRDRSTPIGCGNLNAAIGLLHPFLGHQGHLGNLQDPIG